MAFLIGILFAFLIGSLCVVIAVLIGTGFFDDKEKLDSRRMNTSTTDKYYVVENGKINTVYITIDKYWEWLSKKKNVFYYHKDAVDFLSKEHK